MLEEWSLPFRLLFGITVFLLSLCSTVVAETNLEVKKACYLPGFVSVSCFFVAICCFLLLLQMPSVSGPSFVILRKSSRTVSQSSKSSSVQDFVVFFFLAF